MRSYQTTNRQSNTNADNAGVRHQSKFQTFINTMIPAPGFAVSKTQQISDTVVLSIISKWTLALAISFLLLMPQVLHANGIPVQVFLDYLPFKSTWEAAKQGRGVAVIASNDELVRVNTQKLPKPPQGNVYYAWLEKTNGEYLPVGALNYQADGTASIDQTMPELPYSENFAWILVSLEDSSNIGNSPSSQIALAGRLPNPVALPDMSNSEPGFLPVTGAPVPDPFIRRSDLLAIILLAAVVSSYYVFRLARAGLSDSHQRIHSVKVNPDKFSG